MQGSADGLALFLQKFVQIVKHHADRCINGLLRDSGRALWLNRGRVGLFPGGDILLDHAPNHFLQFVASKQLAADMDLHSLTSFQLRVPLQIFADCLYDEIALLIL